MKKELQRVIDLADGVTVLIEGNMVTVKADGKELSKKFDMGRVAVVVEGSQVKVGSPLATRRESKMIGTIWAHLKNMLKGVRKEFVYKMEICNVHFPMNVKVVGDQVIIKSLLGETVQRVARIMPNSKVEINGSDITVTSNNIEMAGQTAANIEKATRVKGRDRRIFQDGIFITEKNGRKI
jgi:large subunit ribosomal protein L6